MKHIKNYTEFNEGTLSKIAGAALLGTIGLHQYSDYKNNQKQQTELTTKDLANKVKVNNIIDRLVHAYIQKSDINNMVTKSRANFWDKHDKRILDNVYADIATDIFNSVEYNSEIPIEYRDYDALLNRISEINLDRYGG